MEEFERKKIVERDTLAVAHSELLESRATFVTLTINGQLRGCIGSLVPQRVLIDDIAHNAKAAAFSDPRFSPLTKPEYERVHVEISLLSIPQALEYNDIADLKSKLRPDVDGVILKKGHYQATFLPQVWEQLPSFELFFAHLCQKAGLGGNCLEQKPEIYTYQAEKIKE